MANIHAMLEEGWAAIQSRFLETLRKVAEGGEAGAWSSGLRSMAGTDFLNASTGRTYQGAFNRAILAMRLGSRLDRRVATACQLGKMGHPDPAVFGIACHGVILTPIKLSGQDEDGEDGKAGEPGDAGKPRVVFRPAQVFSIDLLRGFQAEDGTRPWGSLPPVVELPEATWTAAFEDGALSLILSLAEALGAPYQVGLVKCPHVAFTGGVATIHMPDPAQHVGTEDVMLANRLSSFLHEATHWTGFGGAGDKLKRDMTGAHGSLSYARDELVAEITATRLLQLLGLEETEGFLSKKAAYVGGWAKPLLAKDGDCAKLLRGVLEDVERVVAHFVEALRPNPFFAARMDAIEELARLNRIPDALEPMASEIPDWRDADGMDALTPAQVERARASYEAKKGKGASIASGSFDDFVRKSQNKRSRRGERQPMAA